MNYRKLGRTDFNVSEIAVGTEYLHGQSTDTVCDCVKMAVENGSNYFDVLFSFPEYRDNIGKAIKPYRNNIYLAGHVGCSEKDGLYRKTRDMKECVSGYEDLLCRLSTDRIDVLFLQYVDDLKDWEKILNDGLYDYALRQKKEGNARYIGLSSHSFHVASKIVASGLIDVLMYPRHLLLSLVDDSPLYALCSEQNVGIVAMKPFAGGKLFTGTENIRNLSAKCISYVLSDSRVSCAVPGVANADEMKLILDYYGIEIDDNDYREIINELHSSNVGECVYCNHCQPCPEEINIGRMMNVLDKAIVGRAEEVRDIYESYEKNALDCTGCGECTTRCPYSVNVADKMQDLCAIYHN